MTLDSEAVFPLRSVVVVIVNPEVMGYFRSCHGEYRQTNIGASRTPFRPVSWSRSNARMGEPSEKNEKRVKVSKTHKRKLFFEKFLFDWKNEVEDRNFGSILWRAYSCMKRYPLELNNGEEAKLLKGFFDRLNALFANDMNR